MEWFWFRDDISGSEHGLLSIKVPDNPESTKRVPTNQSAALEFPLLRGRGHVALKCLIRTFKKHIVA